MTVSSKKKRDFLAYFRTNIIQARKLLNERNHRWADKLLTNVYFEIEKSNWLDLEKKRQLAHIISNSWWMYLNSLSVKRKQEALGYDIIRYVDGLKRFFLFLEKLNDMYLFESFAENLLDKFIKMENLSVKGITLFMNSLSNKVKSEKNYEKLIEYQIILMILRKTVKPTSIFQFSFNKLEEIVFKIEPGKRALFLYILIENVNIKYHLEEDSNKFVQKVQSMLLNRIAPHLRSEFSNLGRISINERNYKSICEDLVYLINYLNNLGEHQWLISIIRNLFEKYQRFESLENATTNIKKLVESLLNSSNFKVAYEIYDLIEDELMYQGDLGYDTVLIELWVEATTQFSQMGEKKYLLQSLEKLKNHLSLPQSKSEIFHYFYTWNYIWELKTKFFSLDPQDFWRMAFYRILFELGEIGLAVKISSFFEEDLRSRLDDLASLYKIGQSLKQDIFQYPLDNNLLKILNEHNSNVQKVVLNINDEGKISYFIELEDLHIFEGDFVKEYWNDSQIVDIYIDIFLNNSENYDFNLKEFGKLMYSFLPYGIRTLLEEISTYKNGENVYVYILFSELMIPFELILSPNLLGNKLAISYYSKSKPISGISLEGNKNQKHSLSNNALIFESINSRSPIEWNEKSKVKDLLFPYPEGEEELNFIISMFNNLSQLENMKVLNGLNSTKEKLLSSLSQESFKIISFVGNLFFSKNAPQKSYFLTNNNQIITMEEIINEINTKSSKSPFLVFDIQMFNHQGEQIYNLLQPFSRIFHFLDYNSISGALVKNYPIFNDLSKHLLMNFSKHLIENDPQGIALLKARQSIINQNTEEEAEILDIKTILSICSFALFGSPWKTME